MKNETICRIDKPENYSVINNKALRDEKLSWKAKGLFAYMMTNKNGWEFYIDELKNHSTDGKIATKNAFNELGKNGYISVKIKYNNVAKRFAGREIVIYDEATEDRAERFKKYLNKFKHKGLDTNVHVSSELGNPADITNINLNQNEQQRDFKDFENLSTSCPNFPLREKTEEIKKENHILSTESEAIETLKNVSCEPQNAIENKELQEEFNRSTTHKVRKAFNYSAEVLQTHREAIA